MSKPAFPRPISELGEIVLEQDGMNLLEYYAGQALVGLWAACAHPESDAPTHCDFDIFAKACFDQAEAMVKEAEKRNLDNDK